MKKTLGIIGRKLGMTQVFLEDGSIVPATIVEAGPCKVVQKKTLEKDGYNALQLGFYPKEPRKVNKPLAGHFKKAEAGPYYVLKEFRLESVEGYDSGQEVTVNLFNVGDIVDVTGLSKGRGFAGVIKRHKFHGGDETHGSKSHAVAGSIGSSAYPSRVFKGKRMAGHMGNKRFTVRNLAVVEIDLENNLILVRGAVPGAVNSILRVTASA